MMKKMLPFFVEPVAFMGLFLLTINRIVWGGGYVFLSGATIEKVLPEIIFWILVGVLFLWIPKQKKNIYIYIYAWRRNWILLGFIFIAICSIFWCAYPLVAIYKVFVLIACSTISAYIGINFPGKTLIKKLSYFFVFVIILSYSLALLIPVVGTNIGYPYFGAWRGWFDIKNYMAPVMSVATIIYLFNALDANEKIINRLLSVCFYLLSVGLVFLSQSATGITIMIILNAGAILFYAWVKWKNHLHTVHYIILGILFAGLSILAFTNLSFLFGLLNKNTTFTGRVPLWSFLVNTGLANHPLFGSGFGATWANDQFSHTVQAAEGWIVITAHNGLVETFLSLGLVGTILLISILVLCIYRVTRNAIKEQSFISFFPILLILFVITTNITESFFLELESFTWFLMVFALFSTTPLPVSHPSKS
jgi:exopolysaccharide production protein ExoQ